MCSTPDQQPHEHPVWTIPAAGGFLLRGRWHPSCRLTFLKPLWRPGVSRHLECAGTGLFPGEQPALNLSFSDGCEKLSYGERGDNEDIACCLQWQVKCCQKWVQQRTRGQLVGARACPLVFSCIVFCPAGPDQGRSRHYAHFRQPPAVERAWAVNARAAHGEHAGSLRRGTQSFACSV